ncbi:MAG: Stp1/IreP family PP2C-type Ser/Thr phosphatase [Clostridia bacterium]|nr:Stp1/IreP family PP2C-type Ser/Thr phosphatase [Clostridia bacterium]MDD4386757.1 Stp1/IreP family PP2C-type Ser/Thr phosphatase [Clostridia bacterium]
MYVVRSDVGRKREINEDYYLIRKIGTECDIYIVADGLGGYECGEVASKICAESVYDSILNEYSNIIKSKNKDKYISSMLKSIIKITNDKIFNLEKTDVKYKGMGTTLLVVFRYLNNLYYLSIGDSRIYYINKNLSEIVRLTEDDTYVNTLVKTNIITYEESKNHPQRHILTKAVGVFKDIEVDISKIDDKLNGYILMCTDGVTNMIKKHELLNIFKDNEFDIIAQKIVEESNNRGGTDNITALIIDLSSLN